MSENMKSRQNRVRRNVTALVSAVALACGTTTVVPAAAPKFAAVADAQDANPLTTYPFNVDLSVENLDPNNFNYVLTFDARPRKELTPAGIPSPANLHEFRVWIETDGNTELIREPGAEDFVWASGKTRNIVGVEKRGNGYLIVFGDQATDRDGNPLFYDDGTPQYEVPERDYPLLAKFPARIKEGNTAQTFEAFADASARLASSGDWTEVYKKFQWSGKDQGLQFHTEGYEDNNPKPQCAPNPNPQQPGPQSRAEQWTIAELQGNGYGQQLADVFLGVPPGSDFRLVEVEPDPQLASELKREGYVFGKGWSVRITDPDGKVITQEVMDKATVKVNNPDNTVVPRQPYEGAGYTGNVQPRWLTAFQWPLEEPIEEVDDREVWLRAGTKFEIHQFIESAGCQIQPTSEVASHFVGATIQRSVLAEDNVAFSFPFIGDRVWVDTNANGIQDAEEQINVPGVKVTVSREGEEDRVTTTDANGRWRINNLTPNAEYTVKFELPGDGEYKSYVATKTEVGRDEENDSNGLTFKTKPVPAEGDLSYDLGIFNPASVGDRVWIDADRNGIQDANEKNLQGVKVTVTPPQGSTEQTRTVTTDENGIWKVEGLTPGVEYTVEFTLPDGYKATQALVGDDQGKDSNGLKSTVTLEPGEFNQTYDLGLYQTASIGDYVWEDLNNDGIQQGNEPPITGVVVKVEGPNGETFYTSTNNEGKWLVDDLVPGTDYTVTFTPPTGYAATKTAQGEDRAVDSNGLTFKTGEVPAEGDLTLDLGLVKTASMGDRVWLDEGEGSNRGNGIQDDGEPNVPGVKVTVSAEGEEDRSTVTDSNGNWRIDGLTPGVEYTVTFTPPTGYEVTKTEQGGDRGNDSNGVTSTVTLQPGQHDDTIDLGLVKKLDPATASVGDRVWVDVNANGIQDDDEKNGVPGIKVTVTPPEGSTEQPRTTTTDANGNWRIEGLTPGVEYTVTFELPDGTTVTKTVQGDDRGKDSNEVTSTVTLKPGEYNDTYDLGVVSASVGDRVWLDEGQGANKANGLQDDDETSGVAGVVVRVSRVGEAVRETKTDDKGVWKIDGLTPGVNYRVEFDAPAGYSVSPSNQGEDRGNDSNGLSDTINALKSGENNTSYDLGLYKPSPTTTVSTTTAAPTTTPTTTVTKEPTTTPTTTVTTQVPTTVTTKVTTEKQVPTTVTTQVPTTVTTQVPTTVTTAGNCKTCTPTTVTSNVPTTIATTIPTTLTSTTVVPTTVVKTTTNKVVVTDENTAIIGDKVYVDNNGDGKQDPDENEGVPNVTVIVTGKDGEEQRTVTDKDGNWQLVVQPGDYTVKFETDRVPSVPEQVERSIVVKPGEKKDDIDLGVLRPGTVGDRVWEDANGDGRQDEGEKGVPNVIVKVSRDGEPTRTTFTDEAGKWTVEGLTPNTEYRVEFVTPEGWTRTNTPAETVTLKPGATNLDYDLGIKRVPTDKPVQPGQFGGSIVINNPDGSREGVENVIVRATPPAGVDEPVRTSTSDKGGSWTITDLTPDTEYTVTYIIPRGYQVINLPKGATLDKDGNVTVTAKVNRELPTNLGFDLEVERGSSIPGTPATVTVTETPVTNTTEVQVQSSNDFLAKCWANATQSPFLYLAPIALIGAVGGELARPYMGAVNEQLNQLNAQLQGAFRRDTPEWGDGGRGADREDPFAEFRAQIDAANRQLQQLAADPNVQRLGGIAAGVLALIAAGTVIYDWCSNEPGEAKTASSRRGGATPTTAPTTSTTTSTTSTEPTPKP